ncbi:MAG: ABC transporter substrate-binding protein, partial [Anaeromyxobacteraceae bacterium]
MKRPIALVLCAIALPAFGADTLKIAITGPFTGGSAPMGVSMRDGAKLAISEINAAGGVEVGGQKLKIETIERDDEAKNERGALIGQELASTPGLAGVIGSVNTGVVLAGDKSLQEKGITKIIPPAAGSASMTQWAKPDGPKTLTIFRFAANDGIQAAMVVEEAIRRNFTKVALLHDSTNYGVSGRDDLVKNIK